MTDTKYAPIDFTDNTSSDPLEPNGTRITAERLDYLQEQHKLVAGVQVLDALPLPAPEGVTLAILRTDGRLYFHIGGAWKKVLLED